MNAVELYLILPEIRCIHQYALRINGHLCLACCRLLH